MLMLLVVVVVEYLFTCGRSQTPTASPTEIVGSTDTPIVTIDPDFFTELKRFLGSDYEIINDVSTWNFTDIYNRITSDYPTIFYALGASILLQLPDEMLYWLADNHPDVLAYNKLCSYLSNEDQIEYNCTSNATVYATCPDPFVESNRYSIFYEGCNLKCEYANLLWGLPQDSIDRLLIVRWVTIAIATPLLLIVFVNQYWDSKQSKEYFCQRPLIVQSTFFIIVAFVNVLIQWIVIGIATEDNVLCQSEVNGERGVSFGNPKAEWTPCIVSGIHFFLSINTITFYCAVFTLSLWKQFYAPLRSVWAQMGIVGCCDRLCSWWDDSSFSMKRHQSFSNNNNNNNDNDNVSKVVSNSGSGSNGTTNGTTDIDLTVENDNDNDKKKRKRTDSYMKKKKHRNKERARTETENEASMTSRTRSTIADTYMMEKRMKHSTFGRTQCGACFISCICASSFKYHVLVFSVNIGICVGLWVENILDAFHPLGICYGGGQDEWVSWWYTVFPLLMGACILALFVPFAMFLLFKTRRKTASKQAKETLSNLGFRLGFYYFGILFAMIMIVFMAWWNNAARGSLTSAAETRFECILLGGTFDECVTGYHMPEATFWLVYIALVAACLSTVVVTMHARQIERWINLLPCLKAILRKGDSICECCDRDHTLSKIVDGTYFAKASVNDKSQHSGTSRGSSMNNSSKKMNRAITVDSDAEMSRNSRNSRDSRNGSNKNNGNETDGDIEADGVPVPPRSRSASRSNGARNDLPTPINTQLRQFDSNSSAFGIELTTDSKNNKSNMNSNEDDNVITDYTTQDLVETVM